MEGEGVDPRYIRQASSRADRRVLHGGGSSSSGLFSPLTQLHSAFHKKHDHRRRPEPSQSMVYGRPLQARRAIQLPPRPFSFRQRQGKLDTRTIAQIDLNKVVRETDIDTIQNHLENLAFSDVTLQDVNQYSDEYFLKLFQVAQLTVEYLLNVQESLVLHTEDLETQCDRVASECKTLEEENGKFDAEIALLKQEIKQKQNTIATFEMMLLSQQAKAPGQTPAPANAPVDCVFCNKKFLSTEYLLKHQKKKHFDDYAKRKAPKPAPLLAPATPPVMVPAPLEPTPLPVQAPQPTPSEPVEPAKPDVALVTALVTANTSVLTKQMETLQAQLLQDKTERAKETQALQQQQNAFAQSIVEQMARMQQALQDMQARSQADWMHFTEELLRSKAPVRAPEHIGAVVNDHDEQLTRAMVQDLMKQREKELERRLALEAEQREWATRERQLEQQLLDERQKHTTSELTLTHLMALEAHKYGLDYGLPPPVLAAVTEAVVDAPSPKPAPVAEPTPTPVVVAEKKVPPPLLERKPSVKGPESTVEAQNPIVESPKPTANAVDPTVKAAVPTVKAAVPTVQALKSTVKAPEPIVVEPPPTSLPVEPVEDPVVDDAPHRAATAIQRVVRGASTRRRLAHPHSWLLRLQGHDVVVHVAPETTALDVRRAIATELGGIELHRVLLHDAPSGAELPGGHRVFETNGHLEVEIIPALHADDHHLAVIDELVADHAALATRLQSLRTETLPPHVRPESAAVAAAVVCVQRLARGMLARREAAGRRLDQLVDARLARLQAATLGRIERKPTPAEQHKRRVQDALHARLVQFHVGKAADRIPRRLSTDAFKISMQQLHAARLAQPPEVQTRIAGLVAMIHDAAIAEFDPQAAKEQEATAAAATSIQSVARAVLARQMLAKLRAQHAPAADDNGVVESDAESKEAKPSEKEDSEAKPSEKEDSPSEKEDSEPVMTIDEFNGDAPKAADEKRASLEAQAKAVLADEYEEERAQLQALKATEAKPSRGISPFSASGLQSLRAKRGSISQNAR
ncbi:hypothetical protein ACHHYP_15254 [Achlya hypogyna]|uniref:C2H2-type domain-containing protein n=1 Tax=Achlya hypogyna TaxID=1202772 RepID=A0A1V9YBD5_ACHHY|nr:hypothetical protein ACHHYP_15254 [Achlya hypogyna]